MSKIIIHNASTLSDKVAIGLVMLVMADGRISRDNKSYCAYTHFPSFGVNVSADITKTGTDVFRVWDKVSK